MFVFKFEDRMKKCPCKNKTVQQTVISINQLFKVHEHTCPQPWLPLNGLVNDMILCMNSAHLTEINHCFISSM